MATDVYRAPEMRHRAGERHFSSWDGVWGSCPADAPLEGLGPGLRDGGVSCSLCPKPQPGWGVLGSSLQSKVGLCMSAFRIQGASAPLRGGVLEGWHRLCMALGSGAVGLGVCFELGGLGCVTATSSVSPEYTEDWCPPS